MRLNFRSSIYAAPAAALLLIAACGGGGDAGPTNPGGGGVTPVLTSIQLSAASNSIAVGATTQLTVSPRDQNGGAMSVAVNFTASPQGVAGVTQNGVVTGINAGVATISATSGNVTSNNVTITVTAGGGTFPINVTVTTPGNSFAPFQVDIQRTGTVTWSFGADAHNVIFGGGTGAPADIQVTSNANVSRTFNTAGQFLYTCTLHPGMNGQVVVH